jgi:superfamily II DNA or RNA helicase
MIILKTFQQTAVNSAYSILHSCLDDIANLHKGAAYRAEKEYIIQHKGNLLFESPTGTGKTLMMGHVAEKLSINHKMIWIWLAPFGGVIEQTRKVIKQEFKALYVSDVKTERSVANLRSGNVYVTTWSSVAMTNADSRKSRQDTETMPSLDVLFDAARASGFSIGVIIDEAHHSFRGQTQAYQFYKNIIAPEITIMSTATPRDADIEAFVRSNDIKHLSRITVSRQQGIDAGLLKKGIKVGLFRISHENAKSLVDFDKTALLAGLQTHRDLHDLLKKEGVTITPLLLVQARSNENIEDIRQWLQQAGMAESKVRVHTADEPDPHLMSIAIDEEVEVLIFKMAVATGFDAPRAFTLVSMRTSRDPDFGIQIIGRIMRVDRRLQSKNDIPEALRYGYVFLSDKETQSGLTGAAQRINLIRDELSPVSKNVNVIPLSGMVTKQDSNGQVQFVLTQSREEQSEAVSNTDEIKSNDTMQRFGLFSFEEERPLDQTVKSSAPSQTYARKETAIYTYPLNTALAGVPKRLKRAQTKLDMSDLLDDIVNLFDINDEVINITQQSAVNIVRENIEIFTNRRGPDESVQAALLQKEIYQRGQASLFAANKDGTLSIKSLQLKLEEKLKQEFTRRGWMHMTDKDKVREALYKILVLKSNQLHKAIKEATFRHIESVDAEPLPEFVESMDELDYSRYNIYSIYPDDLNTWELAFAKWLDADDQDVVRWWHRNPPRKPYSVLIPIPGHGNFYPDFVVGVKDRTRGNGILLIDTKERSNDEEGQAVAKIETEHMDYKKVMIVYWENKERWMTVEYNPTQNKNQLDRILNYSLMQSY